MLRSKVLELREDHMGRVRAPRPVRVRADPGRSALPMPPMAWPRCLSSSATAILFFHLYYSLIPLFCLFLLLNFLKIYFGFTRLNAFWILCSIMALRIILLLKHFVLFLSLFFLCSCIIIMFLLGTYGIRSDHNCGKASRG